MTRPPILSALVLLLAACGGESSFDAPDPPFVQFFMATPGTISAAGQAVTLSWNVLGSYSELSISADNSVSPVAVVGTSIVVYPNDATTYTLTASSVAGSSSAEEFVYISSSGLPAPITPPEPVEPEGPGLEYILDTDCDDGALVTYATPDGGTGQEYRGSGTIYSVQDPVPSGTFVYLSAQNQCDDGYVTVTIKRFGEVFRTQTSRGAYVIATVSGTY